MLKEIWVEIPETAQPDEREELFTTATEACATVVEGNHVSTPNGKNDIAVVDEAAEAEISRYRQQGRRIAVKIAIKGKEDENRAVEAAALGADYIIIDCHDWRVIPLENIIAKTRGKTKLIAQVSNAEEAQLVLETLELGTDGVMLRTTNPDEITKAAAIVRKENMTIPLTTATVTAVKQIGTGARVCVDTCDLMQQGEGILVGSQAAGLFLVEAEVHENPYVASRPFRVNAGSLPLYTLASMENTRYLSELKAGDEVLIVDREGNVRTTNVGRAKIEFRPLILVEAEADGKKLKAVLQNAETIRLVTSDGSKPVTELKAGDRVMVHVASASGRHFGVSVPEEKVIER